MSVVLLIRRLPTAGAFALAGVLLILAGSSGLSVQATTPAFEPGAVTCFENLESTPACDGDSGPGASADLRTQFCLGWGADCSQNPASKISQVKDLQYRLAVFFTPSSWTVPTANEVATGALAGQVAFSTTLGVLNSNCYNVFGASFTLMNASVDINDTISPKPDGEDEIMGPLSADTSPQDGIPDGVGKYPTYLNTLLSNGQPRSRLFALTLMQGTWTPVDLILFNPGASLNLGHGPNISFDASLGYPGILVIQIPDDLPPPPFIVSDRCAPELANVTLLGTTLDNPCSPASIAGANCPGARHPNPQRGYPLLPCESPNAIDEDHDDKVNDGCPTVNALPETGSQCDNSMSDDGEDSAINDGCPQVGVVREGSRMPGACAAYDEGGCVFRQNPASGPHTFTVWTESQRDADVDGIENELDVCATTANAEWNPRAPDQLNDTDFDGLPNACDPMPFSAGPQSPVGCELGIVGHDEDQDCIANRDDNCPLVNQLENPTLPAHPNTNVPLLTDTDGDGIGDACDPDPAEPTGDFASLCLKATLHVGQPATPVVATKDPNPGPGCADRQIGDVDCGGGINAVDALRVLRHTAGLPDMLPGGCAFSGDVNCSGVTNEVDALELLRYSAGLPNSPVIECPAIGS